VVRSYLLQISAVISSIHTVLVSCYSLHRLVAFPGFIYVLVKSK